MKPITWLGIVLIIAGAFALAYKGFNYTRQEKVLDVGSLHATAERHERVSIPPVLEALALLGGVGLVVLGVRRGS